MTELRNFCKRFLSNLGKCETHQITKKVCEFVAKTYYLSQLLTYSISGNALYPLFKNACKSTFQETIVHIWVSHIPMFDILQNNISVLKSHNTYYVIKLMWRTLYRAKHDTLYKMIKIGQIKMHNIIEYEFQGVVASKGNNLSGPKGNNLSNYFYEILYKNCYLYNFILF